MAFPRSYLFLLDPIDVEDAREIELLSNYLDLLEKLDLPSRLQPSTREDTGSLSFSSDNILVRQLQVAVSELEASIRALGNPVFTNGVNLKKPPPDQSGPEGFEGVKP